MESKMDSLVENKMEEKIESGLPEGFVYERRANYYETDQMGIIHHSNYIRWMEEARIAWMKHIGVSYREMEAHGIISPVLSVNCEYHTMTRFDDEVLIEVEVTRYTGIKLDISYRILDKTTGDLRVKASSGHCFLNEKGKPVSLQRAWPQVHEMFLAVTPERKPR